VENDDEAGAAHRPLGKLWVYFSFLYSGHLVALVGLLLLLQGEDQHSGFVVAAFGLNLLVVATVYLMVLLYRIWRHVIRESRSSGLQPSVGSPGKAIGFLFIPLFNLYWVFVAIGRLPRDINALAAARQVSGRVPVALGYATAILSVVSVIPFAGYATSFVVSLVLMPVFVTRAVGLCGRIEIRPAAGSEARPVSDTAKLLASVRNWPDLFRNRGANVGVGVAFPLAYLASFLVLEAWSLLWLLRHGSMDRLLASGILILAQVAFHAVAGTAFVTVNSLVRRVWLLPPVWGFAWMVLGIVSSVTLEPIWARVSELSRPQVALMPSFLAGRVLWGVLFMTGLIVATRLRGVRIWSLPAGLVVAYLVRWAIREAPGMVAGYLEYGVDRAYLAADMMDLAIDAVDEAIMGIALYVGFLLQARARATEAPPTRVSP
jgi:hypothetical protein